MEEQPRAASLGKASYLMTNQDDLDSALAFVRAAIPGVSINDAGLRSHATSMQPHPEYLVDFCFAYAAMTGDPRACRELEMVHKARVNAAMGRAGLSEADLADATQTLWTKLLTANDPGRAPRLARYAGHGPLAGWLRVCAAREAVNARRQHRRFEPLRDMTAEFVSTSFDLEAALARAEAAPLVRTALNDVLGQLPAKFQNLLRHRFIDRLSSEELASMYGVHRATVDRWIVRVRESVLAATRRAVQAQLDLRPDSARSLVDAIVADLEMSFSVLACDDLVHAGAR